jgi:16S rRNA (uracil1498-N3)-methyltransferase
MQRSAARAPRLFVDADLTSHTTLTLEGDATRHAATVLRLRAGDDVTLFNGRGGEFAARVQAAGRKHLALQVSRHDPIERESPLCITLLQGISAADRMDITLQKGVELGVREFHPLDTERSVVRLSEERAASRLAHWQRVVIAACEQCGRNRIPGVHAVQALRDYCTRPSDANRRLLLSPSATLRLRDSGAHAGERIEIATGPEAGFSGEEERLLRTAGFVPVGLGPRVLRTETAALAAVAALAALAGDG